MRHLFGAIVVVWIIVFLFLMGAVIPMITNGLLQRLP